MATRYRAKGPQFPILGTPDNPSKSLRPKKRAAPPKEAGWDSLSLTEKVEEIRASILQTLDGIKLDREQQEEANEEVRRSRRYLAEDIGRANDRLKALEKSVVAILSKIDSINSKATPAPPRHPSPEEAAAKSLLAEKSRTWQVTHGTVTIQPGPLSPSDDPDREETLAFAKQSIEGIASDFQTRIMAMSDYINRTAKANGFWPPEGRNVGEMLMLVTTELAEAMEAARKDTSVPDRDIPSRTSFEVEIADAILRLLDIAYGLGFTDIGGAIVDKAIFNTTRPHKHGKKC